MVMETSGMNVARTGGLHLPTQVWGMALAVAFVDLVWVLLTPMSIAINEVAISFAVLAGLAFFWFIYTYLRPSPQIAALALSAIFLLFHTNSSAPMSYLAASFGNPSYDGAYVAIDQAIGFDWMAFIMWANERPVFIELTRWAYYSSFFQIIFVLILLSFTQQYDRLKEFCFGYGATCIGVITIFGLVPSLGPYAYFTPDPEIFSNLDPVAAQSHLAHVKALRSGEMTFIVPSGIKGIIPFPSFHTCLAILVPYALRNTRYVRGPVLLLNVVVIAGTLTEGGHYFVDLVGGAVLTGLVIALMPLVLWGAKDRDADLSVSAKIAA